MRAPRRRRTRRRTIDVPPEIDLDGLANRVVYEGSAEHKVIPRLCRPDRDFVPTRLAAHGRSRTGKWFPNGCGCRNPTSRRRRAVGGRIPALCVVHAPQHLSLRPAW